MNQYIPLITAFLGVAGTVIVGRWTNKTTLTQTNIDNATKLYERYESLNEKLTNQVNGLELEMREMKKQMEQMQEGFNIERETFKEQIKIKDITINKLNIVIEEKEEVIIELSDEVEEKDKVIEQLKGEI